MIAHIATASAFIAAATTLAPAQHADDFAQINAKLRDIVDGERTLHTATQMDLWWRWPGTPGFDKAIDLVEENLRDAGYILESQASADDRLIYRIEEYPLRAPAWEPLSASVTIIGEDTPLLSLERNFNMIAINSASTPPGGIEVEVVDVGSPGRRDWPDIDVAGKVVLGRVQAGILYNQAVQVRSAAGVLSYAIPTYNRAEEHPHSIPFTSIGRSRGGGESDATHAGFAVNLSTHALQRIEAALARGPVRLHIDIQTGTREAPERVIIAEVRGSTAPQQRFMFSAHVQEPGANDNASGVAAQIEIARALAAMLRDGSVDPQRTITMLWGDEISAPARYLRQNDERRADVRFGMSLDMVGADPAKTGGVFLIEKMPDPSAIWTRGEDEHTEWGGRPLRESDMQPHFLNDFVLNRLLDQAKAVGWEVKTNPYEGGSDHVPFLRADIPAVLLWHFTDVYYHTDGDRADNLSAATLANAATSAATCAVILASPTAESIAAIIAETLAAARARLDTEARLSASAIVAGEDAQQQAHILRTWAQWYRAALASVADVCITGPADDTQQAIEAAQRALDQHASAALATLTQ